MLTSVGVRNTLARRAGTVGLPQNGLRVTVDGCRENDGQPQLGEGVIVTVESMSTGCIPGAATWSGPSPPPKQVAPVGVGTQFNGEPETVASTPVRAPPPGVTTLNGTEDRQLGAGAEHSSPHETKNTAEATRVVIHLDAREKTIASTATAAGWHRVAQALDSCFIWSNQHAALRRSNVAVFSCESPSKARRCAYASLRRTARGQGQRRERDFEPSVGF